MSERYGEQLIKSFDVDKDLELWPNKHKKSYVVNITLPEFMCMCPLSGYPDFATICLEYTPKDSVVELKALKLYINSFKNKYISHEDSINEIYDVLSSKLNPKYIKIIAKFNPRGNVSTQIEINSETISKY